MPLPAKVRVFPVAEVVVTVPASPLRPPIVPPLLPILNVPPTVPPTNYTVAFGIFKADGLLPATKFP